MPSELHEASRLRQINCPVTGRNANPRRAGCQGGAWTVTDVNGVNLVNGVCALSIKGTEACASQCTALSRILRVASRAPQPRQGPRGKLEQINCSMIEQGEVSGGGTPVRACPPLTASLDRNGRHRRSTMEQRTAVCAANTGAVLAPLTASPLNGLTPVLVDRLGHGVLIGRPTGIVPGLARRARVSRRLGSTGAFIAGSERDKGEDQREKEGQKWRRGNGPTRKGQAARGPRAA